MEKENQPQKHQPPRMLAYLTVKEIAERTGLSEERVRQLIRTHEIRCAIKLGGWLVRIEDFEAFLKSRTYGPPNESSSSDDRNSQQKRKAG